MSSDGGQAHIPLSLAHIGWILSGLCGWPPNISADELRSSYTHSQISHKRIPPPGIHPPTRSEKQQTLFLLICISLLDPHPPWQTVDTLLSKPPYLFACAGEKVGFPIRSIKTLLVLRCSDNRLALASF